MINSIDAIDYSVMRIGAGGLECGNHSANLYGLFLDWKCNIPASNLLQVALVLVPLLLVGIVLYGFWDTMRPKQYPTEQQKDKAEESK